MPLSIRHLAELGIAFLPFSSCLALPFHHTLQDVESIRHLAELGVVFLLFNIGLELSFDRLASMGKFVFGMGTAQVTLAAWTVLRMACWWRSGCMHRM